MIVDTGRTKNSQKPKQTSKFASTNFGFDQNWQNLRMWILLWLSKVLICEFRRARIFRCKNRRFSDCWLTNSINSRKIGVTQILMSKMERNFRLNFWLKLSFRTNHTKMTWARHSPDLLDKNKRFSLVISSKIIVDIVH